MVVINGHGLRKFNRNLFFHTTISQYFFFFRYRSTSLATFLHTNTHSHTLTHTHSHTLTHTHTHTHKLTPTHPHTQSHTHTPTQTHTHTHTHSHTHTLDKSPLEEGSACRTDLYLTTHNTKKRQTSVTPAGFEPKIPASERPQAEALDCAATEIGGKKYYGHIVWKSGRPWFSSLSARDSTESAASDLT